MHTFNTPFPLTSFSSLTYGVIIDNTEYYYCSNHSIKTILALEVATDCISSFHHSFLYLGLFYQKNPVKATGNFSIFS